MTWLIPLKDLTPDQQRAVRLSRQEHRIVFGAPGSGKTQILVHRAAYLRDNEQILVDRLHLFVFTNVLDRYIRSGLDLLDIPPTCVSTLDGWCEQFRKKHIGRLPGVQTGEDRFLAKRRAVLEWLRANPASMPLYDAVLVDEGQDLDGVSFDLLTTIARHVTVFMDSKQQIYEQGSAEPEVLGRLGLTKRNMTLLDAFRCCPHIVHVASAFIQNEQERQQYIQQARTAQVEREIPLLYRAEDAERERNRLIDIVRTRQLIGDRIGILFPQKRQVAGYAQGLSEAGLQVETQDLNWRTDETEGRLDFNSTRPKLLTYHSAKGLTFDTILLPRLTAASFPDISVERLERLLFVGITRATKWVYMSTTIGKELTSLKKLDPLLKTGHLVSQDHDVTPQPVPPVQGDGVFGDLL